MDGLDTNDREKMELTHGDDDIDFSILVLGSGSWPLHAPFSAFNLPEKVISYLRLIISFWFAMNDSLDTT